MHEHQLARDVWPVLEQMARTHGLTKVTRVVLDVGIFHGATPEFLIHSFEHLFEKTPFQGAAVEINTIEPGQTIQDPNRRPALATGREIIIRTLAGE